MTVQLQHSSNFERGKKNHSCCLSTSVHVHTIYSDLFCKTDDRKLEDLMDFGVWGKKMSTKDFEQKKTTNRHTNLHHATIVFFSMELLPAKLCSVSLILI